MSLRGPVRAGVSKGSRYAACDVGPPTDSLQFGRSIACPRIEHVSESCTSNETLVHFEHIDDLECSAHGV